MSFEIQSIDYVFEQFPKSDLDKLTVRSRYIRNLKVDFMVEGETTENDALYPLINVL